MRANTPVTARTVALTCSLVVALALLAGAAAAAPAGEQPVDQSVGAGSVEQTRPDPGGDGTVVADGEVVADDLTVLSGSAEIHGTLRGDLTVLSGSVTVTGEVTGDVTAVSGSVEVAEDGVVGGDLTGASGSIVVDGRVDGDVTGAGAVTLGSTASVGGDVRYGDSIERADGATVGGSVSQGDGGEWSVVGIDGAHVGLGVVTSPLWDVYWAAVALVVGALVLLVAPGFATDLATRAGDQPLRSGAAGVVTLVGVPVVLVAFAITIVGIPVALVGAGLFALALALAYVCGAFVAGTTVLSATDASNRWLALLVGVVGVELLARLPAVGGLLELVVLLLGLGAGALVVADRWRDRRGGSDGARDAGGSPPEPGVAAD